MNEMNSTFYPGMTTFVNSLIFTFYLCSRFQKQRHNPNTTTTDDSVTSTFSM